MLQTYYPSVSFASCHLLKMTVLCVCIGFAFTFFPVHYSMGKSSFVIINKTNLIILGLRTSFIPLENVLYCIYTKCSVSYTTRPKVIRKENTAMLIALTHRVS